MCAHDNVHAFRLYCHMRHMRHRRHEIEGYIFEFGCERSQQGVYSIPLVYIYFFVKTYYDRCINRFVFFVTLVQHSSTAVVHHMITMWKVHSSILASVYLFSDKDSTRNKRYISTPGIILLLLSKYSIIGLAFGAFLRQRHHKMHYTYLPTGKTCF